MILIGLRNPGEKYKKTRHNVGAIVLEYLAKEQDLKFNQDKYTDSERCGNMYLPNTFMNLSGESVYKILKKEYPHQLPLIKGETSGQQKIYVFFDDVTIATGQYRISIGEGASSHNGIKSIIESIDSLGMTKDDFVRVRIGVGKVIKDESGKEKLYEPGPDKLSDFVLGNLNNLEITQIQSISKEILDKIQTDIY